MPKRDEKLSQALQFLLNIYNIPNACSSKEFKYSKILSIPLRDGKAWNIRLSRNSPLSAQNMLTKDKESSREQEETLKISFAWNNNFFFTFTKIVCKKSIIMKLRTVKIPKCAFEQYYKRHTPFCWSKRQNAHVVK